jgi:ABC-2 type transport system permease protein
VNLEIVTLDLSFRRKSIIGYSLGMAFYVLVVVALYPSFKDATNLDDLMSKATGLAALFGITGSLTSPIGWLNANIYANFFPLLILLLTIGYGSSCLADGTLELVMSLPFSRRQVVGQKVAVLVAEALGFSVVVFVFVMVGKGFDLTFDVGHVATATLAVTLLGVDFGLLALAIGGATGKRGTALATTAAVASASYLLSSMAPLVSWLKPARYLSLFYWSVGNGQLGKGLSIGGAAVLVGVAIVLAVLSIVAFDRHDLA